MGSLIESGHIRKRGGFFLPERSRGKEVSCKMCFLGENCLKDILELQNLIARNLSTPEIFRLQETAFFRDLFGLDRAVIGVLTEDGLIAYSIIRFPGDAEDNLGRDIGLSEREQRKVAHLQAAVVHPAYRGDGLQRRMATAHLRVIEDLGYEHVCCTVSPKNPFSLSNVFACGFVIEGLKPKFEGWWRYIMYKNISPSRNLETRDAKEVIAVKSLDIQAQVDLLKQGFVGFKMAHLPEGFEVFYGKFRY
jgi:ribosomal protein S18 acetylase RimI-like enzyme